MTTYIRVRDLGTGHEYDLPEGSALITRGLVEPVKADRYPPAEQPRRPKYHTTLAGRSASRSRKTTTTKKES